MNKFKLPIEYLDNKKIIDENIKKNLELYNNNFEDELNNYLLDINANIKSNNFVDNSFIYINTNNLYENLMQPSNIFSKLSCNLLSNYYTTNKKYLKEYQNLLENIEIDKFKLYNYDDTINIFNLVHDIQNDTGFIEKYQYLEIPFLKELNNNSSFLQILSLYNLSSPLLSILLPFLMLIFPFLILILKGEKLNLENYMGILKLLFKNNAIWKLFNNYASSSIGEKTGLIFWSVLYIYQIYNNCFYCYKFYKNIKLIHEKIFILKSYLIDTIQNFNNFELLVKDYSNFKKFAIDLKYNKDILINLLDNINNISEYKISINKIFELGNLMKIFYILHNDISIYNCINYSFYFNGFIENNINFSKLIREKKINKCKFSNNTLIKGNYYASLINSKAIINDIDFSNNIIITGPNASGKTTILKSVLFNIILSQQFGMGCYKSANINCFDSIFCYLNIPDTNDRDSLFQAEAKVCKKIIDYIDDNENEKCLCVFDELYSGTNPDEAIISAFSVLNYLSTKNCKFIITTHFYKLCELLEQVKNNNNFSMKIINENDKIKFTYKLESGISKIKGAKFILKELNYPDKILNKINEINHKNNNEINKKIN